MRKEGGACEYNPPAPQKQYQSGRSGNEPSENPRLILHSLLGDSVGRGVIDSGPELSGSAFSAVDETPTSYVAGAPYTSYIVMT